MNVDIPDARPDVVVVGAGAAGLMTAIWIARLRPEMRVVAVDGAARLGAKILVAGGGRCNVTNREVTPEDFNATSRNSLKRVLRAYPVEQTVAFFDEIGVELHEEVHGKLFPNTNRARTVLDALLGEARRRNVGLVTSWRAEGIEQRSESFRISSAVHSIECSRVVLATGGLSLPKTGSDGGGYQLARQLGHELVATTPALEPLILRGDFHNELSGISHVAELSVHVTGRKPVRRRGSLLWTHFGISGPVALDISRHWRRAGLEGLQPDMRLNFLPDMDFVGAEKFLIEQAASRPKSALRNALSMRLPDRVVRSLCASLQIDAALALGQLTRDDRRRLVHGLIEWSVPVVGGRGYTFAEATAGGVPLTEVDSGMASRKCRGLYLVGEILDVDGYIGGYNFQWAWSSGWVAAQAIARG